MHRDWLWLDETPFGTRRHEFYGLWLLAALTFGVGDILTTVGVLTTEHLTEANVVVSVAVETFGVAGLATLKLSALLVGVTLQAYGLNAGHEDDLFILYGPPALLAVAGAFVTAYNARLLLG